MPKRGAQPLQGEVLQGTLDLLVLQTLLLGPAHGHTIAYAIENRSDDVLQVEHGSLYPRCTAWKTANGSPLSGALQKTTVKRGTTA